MKILVAAILLNFLFSQGISAQQFNLEANYLNVDGEMVVFKPGDKKNKNVVAYFGHFGIPTDIEKKDGFTILSYFYIPLTPLSAPSAWNLDEDKVLELVEITSEVKGDIYYHFVLTDKLLTESPLVSYIYSVNKGVIMFELLTDHPEQLYHKSYTLIDDFGLGSLQKNGADR
ncbi:hypothetical protein [Pseudidiomarina mangrovi]|uniref:hypothetical protein n=1 Tax=Pseudidiomarina mangrovi TaxID=2487133 RepID=UPI000FCC8091|nr:hypothetical protein [Pseudidiomarina mangrovi]